MKKSDIQWEFVKCQALFVGYAIIRGYKLTEGRGYASAAANAADGGHKRSCHLERLAKDYNLFVGGDWIRGDHAAWRDLGEFWKGLHPRARWGGDWGDYNHISFEWNRVK
jgi:hypothetical protein